MKFNIFNFIPLRFTKRAIGWSKVRAEHLKKYPKCAACGTEKGLEVHHIKPFHEFPELELEPTNLITLCNKSCHLYFGHLKYFQSWNPDVVIDSAKYYEKIKSRP